MKIGNDILEGFNLKGDIAPLHGGQDLAVIINDTVLKPLGDNIELSQWSLNMFSKINPHGYRLSRPLLSTNGTFIYNGWCCTHFEPGNAVNGHIKEKLEVSRMFHKDLAKVDFTPMPKAKDPWSRAQRIAWQKDPLPKSICDKANEVLSWLLLKVTLKKEYKTQVIHSDLAGNILFHENLEPLVIDFSPVIAPEEYAEAILVCDCIAWQDSPIEDLNLICSSKFNAEMIIRAVIFRLCVAALFAEDDDEEFDNEYKCFKPIIEKALEVI